MNGYVIFISKDKLNDKTNNCKIYEFSINNRKKSWSINLHKFFFKQKYMADMIRVRRRLLRMGLNQYLINVQQLKQYNVITLCL